MLMAADANMWQVGPFSTACVRCGRATHPWPRLLLMPLLTQGLKATGSYLARTLSYHGAEFTLADVQLSPQMRCT